MKKKNLIIAAAVMLVALCTACSAKDSVYTASSEEIKIPENAELPTAAETVEKLINDEDVIDIQMEDDTDETESADAEKGTSVEIYYVRETYDEFKTEETEIGELTPEALIKALAKHNIVPVDTSVENFEIKDTDEGRELTLALSDTYKKYLDTMSDDAKSAIVASLANTFLKAYDADVIHMPDIDAGWSENPADITE